MWGKCSVLGISASFFASLGIKNSNDGLKQTKKIYTIKKFQY